MASKIAYKQRNRKDREVTQYTDFTKGMMFSDGVIDEGYIKTLVNFTLDNETHNLEPRPSLSLTELSVPEHTTSIQYDDVVAEIPSEDASIRAVKDCSDGDTTYHHLICGSYIPGAATDAIYSLFIRQADNSFECEFSDGHTEKIDLSSYCLQSSNPKVWFCKTYRLGGQETVHGVPIDPSTRYLLRTAVGAFFGNDYYFFGKGLEVAGGYKLSRAKYDSTLEVPRNVFETVTPKECTISEAVSYGYNMLLGDAAYTFSNAFTASVLQLEGILPYEAGSSPSKLLMTPKKNQPVDLECFYNADSGSKYDFVWEWRETTSSDWTELQKDVEVTLQQGVTLKVLGFKPPAKDIMVRVAAYPYKDADGNPSSTASDTVEKAIVIGFDFTAEHYGTALSVSQSVYDLTTATGMVYWDSRLVLWGIPKDPTILFLSDYNDPSYFPYPNNIVVFDTPIIYAIELMDNLMVFTTDKIYQVSKTGDGATWNTTVIQSHLHIKPWERHLILTVRNMLFFKSGNYYYMMVPKSQSLTGELVLAPITTPITSFFDNFSVNVQNILHDTYGYTGEYSLITYFNYLDYEDVHNIYVFKYDSTVNYLYFDMIYNTVDRTWKIWVYDNVKLLYPYQQEATERGRLATLMRMDTTELDAPDDCIYNYIQIYKWNNACVRDYHFIPESESAFYYTGANQPDVEQNFVNVSGNTLYIPRFFGHVSGTTLYLQPAAAHVDEHTLYLAGAGDFYAGFSKFLFRDMLQMVYDGDTEYPEFKNYQFLDTGYIADELSYKKRYRELQLILHNPDKQPLSFGTEYILDGAPRKIMYKYDVTQAIDELNPDYGVVYVDTIPYLETSFDDVDFSNQWTIDQNLVPDIDFWKVRMAISGKGIAPRFRLRSQNGKKFSLLHINWVARFMHAR